MAIGCQEQIDKFMFGRCKSNLPKWKQKTSSHRWTKQIKHRRARQRARLNPETPAEYRRYRGTEF